MSLLGGDHNKNGYHVDIHFTGHMETDVEANSESEARKLVEKEIEDMTAEEKGDRVNLDIQSINISDPF